MPLEGKDHRFFQEACGFLELGLPLEADASIENIDPLNRIHREILALCVGIYRKLAKWDLMQVVSERLHELLPDDIQWVISYAYAIRRIESVDAAKDVLI